MKLNDNILVRFRNNIHEMSDFRFEVQHIYILKECVFWVVRNYFLVFQTTILDNFIFNTFRPTECCNNLKNVYITAYTDFIFSKNILIYTLV